MSIEIDKQKFYSTDELSEILKVKTNTLRINIRQGKIKAKKVFNKWYVSEEDLKKLFK